MKYGMHSDIDGDLLLHADDPSTDQWVVQAKWSGDSEFRVCELIKNEYFYGTGSSARNAWFIDGATTIRITDSEGHTTEHAGRAYPVIRSGWFEWPPVDEEPA